MKDVYLLRAEQGLFVVCDAMGAAEAVRRSNQVIYNRPTRGVHDGQTHAAV